MSRRTISLLVLIAAFVLLIVLVPGVLLSAFAGILLAVMLRGSGNWIAHRLGLAEGWGLAIFSLALAGGIVLFFWFAAAALAQQVSQLLDELPRAVEAVRTYVDENGWLQRLMDSIDLQNILPSSAGALSTVSATFGLFGSLLIILFVGVYGATSPRTYVNGATMLLAPSLRPRGKRMLLEAGKALRGWLRAEFVSMAVVGVLTGLGLWALEIPLALLLAVLAGALTFIPTLGPILAAVPAVLVSLALGPTTVAWVIGLYLAVQAVESYLVTPRVQQEAVSLPPALTIAIQLLFGTLFGALGLALATPIAAMVLRVVRIFYVEEYLDEEPASEAGTLIRA
ncbi:MAG: AI-2E family transporter [Mesorhizobium amorphae]|nr:MAG: AI-2E family transporter [Mesorhizobium amorphae]